MHSQREIELIRATAQIVSTYLEKHFSTSLTEPLPELEKVISTIKKSLDSQLQLDESA